MASRQYRSTVEAKTLSSGINNSVTSMTLNSVTTLPSTYPYTLVIDPDRATEEIVTVTATGGGNVLTITRGQDGTSAQSHDAAAVVKHMITARDLQEPQDHIDASSSVHGLTTAGPAGVSGGTVVGTAAVQTLTNKTLTNPTITGTITGAVVTSANIVDGTITGTDVASGTITSANITDLTIVNGDISNTAAIAQSKIASLTSDLALKAPLAAPTFTGNVVLPSTTTLGLVNSTELSYLNGVTSAIQTQLNGKSATSHTHSYLPLSGGTLTGQLNLDDGVVLNLGANGWIDLDDGGYIQFSNDDVLSYNDTTGVYSFGADGDANGGVISANEFITSDSAGAETDPAFASPQGTSGMYFVGGSTITGIRFTVNGTVRYQITSSGGANVSSIRTKDNVQTYAVPTEDLLNIRTISYHPKGDERDITAFGVIAEELDEVPSLRIFLDYEEDGSPISVQYDRIALGLINVVKEQQERIDSLEQRLTALEAK
jgi:hypothetical protein